MALRTGWCFTVGELLDALKDVERSKKIQTPDGEDIYVFEHHEQICLSDCHEDDLVWESDESHADDRPQSG